MKLTDPNFRKLYETDKLVLGYEFEEAYLIDKKNKSEVFVGDFYGDPYCGLISENNDWCVVGGDTMVIWKSDGNVSVINDRNLSWIVKVRQTGLYEAELLTDPFSDKAAIWKLNIKTLDFNKLRDYKVDEDYPESFVW